MYISTLIRGIYLGLIVLGLAACAGSADETSVTPGPVTTPDDTTAGDTITVDTTAPTVPGNLRAAGSPSSSSVQLVWNASTDNSVVNYRVMRGNTILTTTASTSYTDTNVLPESTYQYSVVAFDTSDNTATSNILTITTPAEMIIIVESNTTITQDTPSSGQGDPDRSPSKPGNLRTATGSPTSSSIQLLWDASTDDVAVAGYRVMRGGTAVATTTTTSYSDSNLSPESAYQYTIVAFDAADNIATSDTLLVTTLPVATVGAATLRWTAPTLNTDNSPLTDLSGYKIYYGLSSASLTNSITINNIGVVSYVIENLNTNTTYYFSITAINGQNSESAYSNIVSKFISS